ncbi:MAG: sigma-70 family RNA polymerase sigma factor [Firmicutes bacterium]|nr:sigma-70 family RNA polymerase sigma factor [Bacillota bacterium]
MKLKIRYENEYQTIMLDAEATEELWVSLSLEGEGLTQEERERLIQETWEERYNRPDYNNWHKHNRHTRRSKAQSENKDGEEGADTSEPLMSEVADDRIFRRDELAREEKESYEAICQWVRQTLIKKPKWADAFIAVRIDKIPIREYAAAIANPGEDIAKVENNLTQKLKRATSALAKAYPGKDF